MLISSERISDLLGISHNSVMSTIKSHRDSIGDTEVIRVKTKGRPAESYTLTLEQFRFVSLCLSRTNQSNSHLKIKILDACDIAQINDLISSMDVEDLPPDRYVYVARELVSGRYKVGISKDPEARLKELNIGNPEELILITSYKATESGYLSESLAHKALESYHLRSEWFDSSADLCLLPGH